MSDVNLVDYGIQNDKSDLHIHIGFAGGVAYVFKTENGRAAIDPDKHEKLYVGQPGASGITGGCYKVPWQDIEGCQEIPVPGDILLNVRYDKNDTTTNKGKKAVLVAREMLRRGLIPLPLEGLEINDKDMQMEGLDLISVSHLKIQIKCDHWAKPFGLRLQFAERNPNKMH